KTILAAEPDNLGNQFDLGVLLNRLGDVKSTNSKPADAKSAYADALALLEKLAEKYPDKPLYGINAVWTLFNLGVLLTESEPQEAAGAYRRAIAIGHNYPDRIPKYRADLGDCYSKLAIVLCEIKRPDEAAGLVKDCDKYRDVEGFWSFRSAGILCQCMKADRAKAEQHAKDAVAKLRLAIEHGLADVAQIEKEPAFEPIRNRDDFRAVIGQLKTTKK